MAASSEASQSHLDVQELRLRLEEAEQTLEAIRGGQIDAVVVYGDEGQQVYTLKGADQPYRVFVEQMHEGAATLDDSGTILFANAFLAELVDVPSERILGRAFEDLLSEQGRASFKPLFQAFGSASRTIEVELLRGDKRVPVLLSVKRLHDGDSVHHAVTVTDLTTQKQNEEVVAAERLARTILDQATEAIVVCDPEALVIRANDQATELTGSRLIGKPLSGLFPSEEWLGFSSELLRLAETERKVQRRDFSNQDKQFMVSVGPLLKDATVIGFVVALVDTTEKNQAIAAVRELNESLEDRVRERTEQLTAANHELEGFCYSVSHDLRTPLRSITAASRMLVEDHGPELQEGASELLERLARSAKRMGDLIDDLLRFSRLGRMEMEKGPVDMSELAHSVVRELQEHQEAGHVQFVVDEGLVANGDDQLLRMALDNLLGNALKFTKGQPNPRIHFGQASGVFFVEDNGVGFDDQYVHKIFQPFERLHAEAQYPGTGIGLANVQRIILRHGGKIWAESKEGHGAKFSFTLG